MNNNHSTQRRLNENIRVHSVLDKNESSSSDSDFSDGYDRRLDDEFNAMLREARMKQMKVKEEQLSEEEPCEDGMAGNEPFQNCVAVMKHENAYDQAEITKNTHSGETVMAYELNLPDVETISGDMSSRNTDMSQIVNNKPIIAEMEMNEPHESGMEVEVSPVINGVEGNPGFSTK